MEIFVRAVLTGYCVFFVFFFLFYFFRKWNKYLIREDNNNYYIYIFGRVPAAYY